jgi:signal transduction histidine kinase
LHFPQDIATVPDMSLMSSARRAHSADGDAALAVPGRRGGAVARQRDATPLPPSGGAWSLEHRLPVLISLLLACVIGGISLAAYREVRATTISRATERLERVGRELNLSATRTTMARTDALNAIAADSVISRALAGRATIPAVEARVEAARDPVDSTREGWQIATLAGESRLSSAASWSSIDSAALATTLTEVVRTTSAQRSALYDVSGRAHAWIVVPILVDGRAAGTFAELLRVSDNSGADAAIRGLIDDEAHMVFTSRGSNQWISPRGRPVAAPFVRPSVEGRAARVDMSGSGAFAVQYAVPTTPWLIVLYQSEASVLRRPQGFLRRLLGAGIVLLAIATVGAWFLSRHVTRPLRDVTAAAAALAHGDYARRVSASGGGREVASLSTTFNSMAAAIGDAHAELAERNAELQRANAAKAQFLAMMSHELRTPLNAIGGFTELMELGLRGPVTAAQVEDLARIRWNKDLLLSIITDILEFTRADAGALALKLEPVTVEPLLSDIVDTVTPQMESNGLRLTLGPVPADSIALGDQNKVRQVMLNLLSNAMKFTEAGGEVVIDTSVADGAVRIDTRDTGTGIAASQLETIFEPFVQLDASLTRRAGGTGLGLAIARQLAAAMGGTVTVRSTVGVGSTFTLTLRHADHSVAAVADAPAATHQPQIA